MENYPAASLLGLSLRLESMAARWICRQLLGPQIAFPYLPQGTERNAWWAGAQPTNMSLLCFPSLASAVTSWSLPVLMMPTWGLSLGTDSWAGFPPSFLLLNGQHRPPSPHLIALHFIKRGIMNAQLLISKEFPPPGIGSLSSGSETHFFPSLINFLLLLWQAPLYISFGGAAFPSSGSRLVGWSEDRRHRRGARAASAASELSSPLAASNFSPPPTHSEFGRGRLAAAAPPGRLSLSKGAGGKLAPDSGAAAYTPRLPAPAPAPGWDRVICPDSGTGLGPRGIPT